MYDGLHPMQYGFVPRRHITDNIANVYMAMEYAKYSNQDVLLLQVDVTKAFDNVHWDYLAEVMSSLGFGPKMQNLIY